jgi:hypothetical protein
VKDQIIQSKTVILNEGGGTMTKNKSHDHVDDRCERPVDASEVDIQCVIDKDERLGFAADGGVVFEEYKCEKGRLKAQVICDDSNVDG